MDPTSTITSSQVIKQTAKQIIQIQTTLFWGLEIEHTCRVAKNPSLHSETVAVQ